MPGSDEELLEAVELIAANLCAIDEGGTLPVADVMLRGVKALESIARSLEAIAGKSEPDCNTEAGARTPIDWDDDNPDPFATKPGGEL